MNKKLRIDTSTLIVLLLAAAIIAVTLCAAHIFLAKNNTSGDDSESETKEIAFPDVSDQPDRPEINVSIQTDSKSEKYEKDGIELINSNITFPILSGGSEEATEKINSDIIAYVTECVKIKSYEKTLSEDDYKIAQRDGMPFIPFDYNTLCQSVFIKDGYISILFRRIETVGMTEPEETVYSLCYDLSSGERVDYSDYIGTDEHFARDYIKSIISQHINNNPNHYYADALDTLSEAIDLNSFYLTSRGVTLYFNPEIITPSVFGVCSFTVPYDKLGK